MNRTEIDPVSNETPTQPYQHLLPAVEAHASLRAGDEAVTAIVPREFAITLSDGTRQRVHFTPGTYQIPRRLASHYYLKANGVQIVEAGQQTGPAKPVLEGGADPDAVARAAEAEAARITKEKSDAAEASERQAREKADAEARAKAKANAPAWPTDEVIAELGHDALAEVLKEHGASPDDIRLLNSKDARRAAIRDMITKEKSDDAS